MFHLLTRCRRYALAAVCLLAAVLPASAGTILLEIDVSDPSAVTLTPTGASSITDDSTSDMFDGVTLIGFFAEDFRASNVFGSFTGLEPRSAAFFNREYTNYDNDFGGVGLRDLNLYSDDTGWTQRFATNQPAFTGVGVIDFIDSGSEPAPVFQPGTIGHIIAGDTDFGSGDVIGQFQIVGGTPIPEPVAALGGMALLGTIVLRRRHSA